MKKVIYLFSLIACAVLASCGGDDEPAVKFKDVSLACDQTYTIPNGTGATWTSSNDLIASVSGTTVKAKRVGEVTIRSAKGSFKVTVTPTSYIYKDPCLDWGTSKVKVKSYMSSYTLDKEDDTTLNYNVSGAVILYTYLFENSKLESVGIGIDGDYVSTDAMATFLMERYIPVGSDDSTYSFYFISPDEKTAIMMRLQAYGRKIAYIVIYAQASSSKSRSVEDYSEYFSDYDNTLSAETKSAFEEIRGHF